MTDPALQIDGVTVRAHPNIALVKYWGKADTERNLPATGSLSLTLGGLSTKTTVRCAQKDAFRLQHDSDPKASQRLFRFLDVAFPDRPQLAVDTDNDFPTAAGLASSASGFAAVVMAVDTLLGTALPTHRLAQIAGAGSGSAARSLYGGIVRLDPPADRQSDITVTQICDAGAWPLEVIVAVIDEGPKTVGSTEGMESTRATSPYYPAWVSSHASDLDAATKAVERRDFDALATVTEHSYLKMHSVMMSAQPPILYWLPPSLGVIRAIQAQREAGYPVCCTMDAGPQVKVLTTADYAEQVQALVRDLPGVQRTIRSGLGQGAMLLED
ncbi:MAG: diphosphomevalonate decarboxylase [Pseudomonadota bacterium]